MLDQVSAAPALIDQVHDRLVAAIANGDLQPGQRLTQESVATMLGVSRQPVSHAVQLLKRRGLLIEHGRRGLAVAPVDGAKLRYLYQVREALDGLAARLAAERVAAGDAGDSEIAELERALRDGEKLRADASVSDMLDADVAFHSVLYAVSGNPEITATIADQWPQFKRAMAVVLDDQERKSQIWDEHAAIVAAVRKGDDVQAEALARRHTSRAGTETAARIDATSTKQSD